MKSSIELVLKGFLDSPHKVDLSNVVHRAIASDLSSEIRTILNEEFKVKGSPGIGNRADVPWISIIDERVAKTTQQGLYIVYLFKEDMSGLYLALANGITYLSNKYGKKRSIDAIASYLREQIKNNTFSETKPYLGNGQKAKGYADSTVISKYYDGVSIPDDEELIFDLQQMVTIYKSLSDSISSISYETMVDKVINGYKGDLTSMTGTKVETKRFTWVPFYAELANKLLQYKSHRDDLLKIIESIYAEFNERNPLLGKTYSSPTVDVDPFTVFAMINRGIKESKKTELCKAFKTEFDISADVPEDFIGLPTKDNRKMWFFSQQAGYKTGDLDDIDNLWAFYEAALEYADVGENKSAFCSLFDKVIKQKQVSWSLTSALFWIRPNAFMTLDDNSKRIIVSFNLASQEEVNDAIKSGENYLDICSKIASSLPGELSINNFRELSERAWAGKNTILDVSKTAGYNKIFYGMPGCGKSYKVEKEVLKDVPEDDYFRTTFYQDYSYSDFIGQILPVVEFVETKDGNKEKVLSYKFVAGPFVSALERAYANPEKNIYLIIEEINRGNAPSIFGDVFQLLDRDSDPESSKYGQSMYPISNNIVMDYLNRSEKLYIPDNLILIATMNTSDQNVFTLDAAFKRRWQFEEVRNDWNTHPYCNFKVPGTDISWRDFVTKINERIVQLKTSIGGTEDKRLGAFFVQKGDLTENKLLSSDPKCKEPLKRFAYKVLEYLWDDVCRFNKTDLFSEEYKTLSDLIDGFFADGLKVFADGIFE